MNNVAVIIRPEVSNIVILTFLIMYSFYCSGKQNRKSDVFSIFAFFSLGHNIFALVTECTVNMPQISEAVNDLCHVVFFIFSVVFSFAYARYISLRTLPKKVAKRFNIVAQALLVISIISIFAFDINYSNGSGTRYSTGVGPMVCFTYGFLLFILSDALLIKRRRDVDFGILITLLPLSAIAILLLLIQIIVPEFLFTGSTLTIITIGAFFAVENPVGTFERKAMIDESTGLKNKNCFERDMGIWSDEAYYGKISAVVCDVNNLKEVNDKHGHLEGDLMIEVAAKEIVIGAPHATSIYRFGGDEFVLLYRDAEKSRFESDVKRLRKLTRRIMDERLHDEMTIAIGAAWASEGEKPQDTVDRADYNMYQDKEELKREAEIAEAIGYMAE